MILNPLSSFQDGLESYEKSTRKLEKVSLKALKETSDDLKFRIDLITPALSSTQSVDD